MSVVHQWPRKPRGRWPLTTVSSRSLIGLLAVPGLLLLSAESVCAQVGRITGVVTDGTTGDPLELVEVEVEGLGVLRRATTTADGRYTIVDVPVGTYIVVATFLGYERVAVEDSVVSPGVTLRVDFRLVPSTITLDRDTVLDPEYTIRLRSRVFNPYRDDGGIQAARDSVARSQGATTHWLVQFDSLPSASERDMLADRGTELLSYINGNTYRARISTPAVLDQVLDNPGTYKIRWVGGVRDVHKLHPIVERGEFDPWAIVQPDSVRLIVIFFRDISVQQMRMILGQYVRVDEFLGGHSWEVVALPTRIKPLAAEDMVRYIRQVGPSERLHNDRTRREVHTDEVQKANVDATPIQYGGLSGKGIQIAIMDTGVDPNHADFKDEDNQTRLKRTQAGVGEHGTRVAGIAAGSGILSTRYQWRGHAPRSEIYSYKAEWHPGLLADAIANGVDVANYSFDQGPAHEYSYKSEAVDELIWHLTHHAPNAIQGGVYVAASAGNSGDVFASSYPSIRGYFSITGSKAKNTITVGNYNAESRIRWCESSMGPTFDGRLKPDLVAPGTHIMSTVPVNDQGVAYGRGKGTSFASPVVAGVMALMLESYSKQEGPNARPLNSTVKAVLIQTAEDLVWDAAVAVQCPGNDPEESNPDTDARVFYHAGPDWATGYGLIDADSATKVIANPDLYVESEITDTGEEASFEFDVPSGVDTIKVTLAWDDPPASDGDDDRSVLLKNDLDLELISPGGTTTHLPLVLDPLKPEDETNAADITGIDQICARDIVPATEGRDRVNNVEQVVVKDPQRGRWKAVVKGHSLAGPVPQKYSLVLPYSRLVDVRGHSSEVTNNGFECGPLCILLIVLVVIVVVGVIVIR